MARLQATCLQSLFVLRLTGSGPSKTREGEMDKPSGAENQAAETSYHYEWSFPQHAITYRPYEHTAEQVSRLRTRLQELTTPHRTGRRAMTLSAVLAVAGINLNTDTSYAYDTTALKRFIDGATDAPHRPVAAALYKRWVPEAQGIELSACPFIFYHATMIAMNIDREHQRELAAKLAGFYFFYKRSAINPDFFVRGQRWPGSSEQRFGPDRWIPDRSVPSIAVAGRRVGRA